MIVLLNGAFGIGKTTVARRLTERLPRAIFFDPEPIGIALQRVTRVDDFQDLKLWRWLTIAALRLLRSRTVIVPIAISNPDYLDEFRRALEPYVVHFCLVAPVDVIHERLKTRGHDDTEWTRRRAAECCVAHASDTFAIKIDATRSVDEIYDALSAALASSSRLI